jgi:hypothetical protein
MSDMGTLIAHWRDDPGGTYRSRFLWEERLVSRADVNSAAVRMAPADAATRATIAA